MNKTERRVRRSRAGLLVVDLQERLVPAIFENKRVVENCMRLIGATAVLKRPMYVTEQYPKGLGRTLAGVAAAVPNFAPLEKVAFSACGAEGLIARLEAASVSDVILCGVETHVCVSQTCLDLLEADYRVFVVDDAMSSRTKENHLIGMQRMRAAGAVIVSTEMIIFELLERAGTDEFKKILPLVK